MLIASEVFNGGFDAQDVLPAPSCTVRMFFTESISTVCHASEASACRSPYRASLLPQLCGVACSGCNSVESVILGPSIDTKSVPNAVVGAPYSFKIQASGTDLSSWDISATPPGLDFDGGRIKGTPTKGGSFKFEVSVFDYTHDYLKSDSRDFTMLILDITTTGVPNGVANSSYTPTTFSAIGAVGTPAWTLSGGSLPAGMSFSSAGILDGTPTTAGTYPFSVTVKDQDVPPRSRARLFARHMPRSAKRLPTAHRENFVSFSHGGC